MVDLTISVRKNFAKPLMWFSCLSILSFAAQASPNVEIKHCGDRLKKVLGGDLSVSMLAKECRLSSAVTQWVRCQKSATFSEIRHFLMHYPDWPMEEAIRKKAEEDLANFHQSPKEIMSWFKKFPPLTGLGALVYIKALRETKADNLAEMAGKLLTSSSFLQNDLVKFLNDNHQILEKESIFDKANALLDQGEDIAQVKSLIPYLSTKQQQIIAWRLNPSPSYAVNASSHVGLILDQVRLKRKSDQTDAALKLLNSMKEIPQSQADYFWTEQNILGRRLIEQKRYIEAYQIIHKHQLKEGENFANAEWLSGWISLRFLNNPDQALEHFKKLRKKVRSPISVARAEYWLGRTYKSLKEQDESKAAFKAAARHVATYYGQLANKEIHGKIRPITLKKSIIPKEARQKFEARPLVQVIHILLELKETGRAEAFAISLAKQLKSPAEQELLVELMHRKGNKYLGVQIAKKATITSAPLIPEAYPRLTEVHTSPSDPALAHAIIRQESRFKPDAVSPAGAVGLMQLMPATATRTMKKHKLKKGSLTHAATNVSIGTRHLKDLLDYFNGSMILAAAAYNAGVNAVENWLITFGDPRQSKIDAVDWVELIPYVETRNYVQRVLENYYCYLQR